VVIVVIAVLCKLMFLLFCCKQLKFLGIFDC